MIYLKIILLFVLAIPFLFILFYMIGFAIASGALKGFHEFMLNKKPKNKDKNG